MDIEGLGSLAYRGTRRIGPLRSDQIRYEQLKGSQRSPAFRVGKSRIFSALEKKLEKWRGKGFRSLNFSP